MSKGTSSADLRERSLGNNLIQEAQTDRAEHVFSWHSTTTAIVVTVVETRLQLWFNLCENLEVVFLHGSYIQTRLLKKDSSYLMRTLDLRILVIRCEPNR